MGPTKLEFLASLYVLLAFTYVLVAWMERGQIEVERDNMIGSSHKR